MRVRTVLAVLLISVMLFGCSSPQNPPSAKGDQGLVSAAPTGNAVEIDVVAKKWSFSPDVITVKKGDHVRLSLTSQDVTHGFMLPEYGINAVVEPGKTTKIEFTADKAGTFSFRCSVMCGQGHSGQRGTLIVEP